MKRLLLAAALALSFSATASAGGHTFESCGIDSRYSVSFESGGLLFVREDGKPARVLMNKGRLQIDGRDIGLSDADRSLYRSVAARTGEAGAGGSGGPRSPVQAELVDGAPVYRIYRPSRPIGAGSSGRSRSGPRPAPGGAGADPD